MEVGQMVPSIPPVHPMRQMKGEVVRVVARGRPACELVSVGVLMRRECVCVCVCVCVPEDALYCHHTPLLINWCVP